jgi:hypothetical protein
MFLFVPMHIHLHFLVFSPLVQKLVPGTCIDLPSNPARCSSLPLAVFMQGYALAFRYIFNEVHYIFATKAHTQQLIISPSSWLLNFALTTHADVGGVTDLCNACFCWA